MFQDRWYQTEAVQSIWSYFASGGTGNPVVAMPTGTGKSVVIGRFLQSVFTAFPSQRVMMLVDSKELVQQNYEKFLAMWPFAPAGVFSAGLGRKDVGKPITFAGIQSVWKLAALFGHIDLLIIDEVHMVPPKDMGMYRTFIMALLAINPNLKCVGLTATKYHMGQGQITDPIEDRAGNTIEPIFTDVCYDITGVEDFNRLIAEGYLSPLRPKRSRSGITLEADGIHMRGGDFIESELQSFVDQHDELTWAALQEAKQVAIEEQRHSWLIFATGNRHADTIGQMLDQLDVTNCVIHTGRGGRDEGLALARAGHVTATVNNNVLIKGYDNPLIDLLVVLRQLGSVVNWVQLLGRGTRPLYAPGYDLSSLNGRLDAITAGGKLNCRVLDYGGNTRRLGPVNDPVLPKRAGKGGGDAPVKACDRCDEWIHASLRECPYCGYEFTFETKLKGDASEHELVRGDDPVVEVFKVDHITVDIHRKMDKPPSLKLTYYSGLRTKFTDYLTVAHGGFGERQARTLWTEMGGNDMPLDAEEARLQVGTLNMPTHLRVWTNAQYPKILMRCYDGTAFGTQDPCEPPMVEGVTQHAPIAHLVDDLDDDVPF